MRKVHGVVLTPGLSSLILLAGSIKNTERSHAVRPARWKALDSRLAFLCEKSIKAASINEPKPGRFEVRQT